MTLQADRHPMNLPTFTLRSSRRNFTPSRTFWQIRKLAVVATLACSTVVCAHAQETAPTTGGSGARSNRWLHFTAEEIEHHRAVGLARQAKQEAYIRASTDDDVITLAPYIVESDDSLLLARLRRELESYRRAAPSRISGLTPLLDQHIRLARKASDDFFGGRFVGGRPRDAPAIFYFNGATGPRIYRALRDGHLADLFAPPAGAE